MNVSLSDSEFDKNRKKSKQRSKRKESKHKRSKHSRLRRKSRKLDSLDETDDDNQNINEIENEVNTEDDINIDINQGGAVVGAQVHSDSVQAQRKSSKVFFNQPEDVDSLTRYFWALTIAHIKSQCIAANIKSDYFIDNPSLIADEIKRRIQTRSKFKICNLIVVQEYHTDYDWGNYINNTKFMGDLDDSVVSTFDINDQQEKPHFHICLRLADNHQLRLSSWKWFNFSPIISVENRIDLQKPTGTIIVNIASKAYTEKRVALIYSFIFFLHSIFYNNAFVVAGAYLHNFDFFCTTDGWLVRIYVKNICI